MQLRQSYTLFRFLTFYTSLFSLSCLAQNKVVNTAPLEEISTANKAEKTTQMERIVVTGTRIEKLDIKHSSPVTVITREDIDSSGATRLSDVLRESSINTYGSRRESTGGIAQGQSTLNLRGLGEQRTLVLINGHRIANSAAIPDAQNINLIPVNAVERIEIVKDGASSIYGADAVGGVVNIILRKNLQTNNFTLYTVNPKIKGGDETYVGLYGGLTNNIANITYSAEHQRKQAIFARDIELTEEGLSIYGFPGTYRVNAVHPDTNQILTKIVAGSRCPTELNQTRFSQSKIEDEFCQFNFAEYSQLLPESKNSGLMIDANWLWGVDSKTYIHGDISVTSTSGISAPTPNAGGKQYLPSMKAENLNNPTQNLEIGFDTNYDGVEDTKLAGPFDLDIYYRNVLGGARKTNNTDKMLNFYAGSSGELVKNTRFDFTLFYSENRSESRVNGLVRRDLLQSAIDDERFDIFAINNETSQSLAESFTIDSVFEAKFIHQGAKAIFHHQLFSKKVGESDLVFGFEFAENKYHSIYLDEFDENTIDGRAGGGNAQGQRKNFSAFTETYYDFSKALNFNLSLRYDNYSGFGDKISPKLGFTYLLNNVVTLRGSVGSGYRVPSLYELYSQKSQSFAFVRDHKRCNSSIDLNSDGVPDNNQDLDVLGDSHPCRTVHVEAVVSGNVNLESENSVSYTTGFTYQDNKNSRLHFNLYYQSYDNEIRLLQHNELTEREYKYGESKHVVRNEHGEIVQLLNFYENFSGTKMAGVDLDFDKYWQSKSNGNFKWSTRISRVIFNKSEAIPGEGYEDFSGRLGISKGRIKTAIKWYYNTWKSQISVDYKPSTKDYGNKLASLLVTNLYFQKKLNDSSKLDFGIMNLFDATPPNNRVIGWPYYYEDELYIQGRTWYLTYSFTL